MRVFWVTVHFLVNFRLYRVEIIGNGETPLRNRKICLDFGISVGNNSQEHVHQEEENAEDVSKTDWITVETYSHLREKIYRTKYSIS